MNIEEGKYSVFRSNPFQMRMPNDFDLRGGTSDNFYTFRIELSKGVGGVQGEVPLYAVDDEGESWWSCFGFTQIPGLKAGNSELRLFFDYCSFFDSFENQVIASWDTRDSLFCDIWSSLLSPEDGRDLEDATNLIKQLFAQKFQLREIEDPLIQIPNYTQSHLSTGLLMK